MLTIDCLIFVLFILFVSKLVFPLFSFLFYNRYRARLGGKKATTGVMWWHFFSFFRLSSNCNLICSVLWEKLKYINVNDATCIIQTSFLFIYYSEFHSKEHKRKWCGKRNTHVRIQRSVFFLMLMLPRIHWTICQHGRRDQRMSSSFHIQKQVSIIWFYVYDSRWL